MSDVTRLLDAAAAGDPQAAADLLPLVYDELRKLAAARLADEKPGQTLQPPPWSTRPTCGWSAATSRRTGTAAATSSPPPPRPCAASWSRPPAARPRAKHGGGRRRVDLLDAEVAAPGRRRTAPGPRRGPRPAWRPLDPQAAELVKLRFFAGLTHERGRRRPRRLAPAPPTGSGRSPAPGCGGMNRTGSGDEPARLAAVSETILAAFPPPRRIVDESARGPDSRTGSPPMTEPR